MSEIKLNHKYNRLFVEDKRYYYVTGGRGSGKSYGVTTFLVNLTYTPGHKILFLRYTMTSAHLSIIPQFTQVIEDLGIESHFEINKTEITNKQTGVSILFRGVKTGSTSQTANLKSITGITTVVFDEFEEIPDRQIFKKIDYSVRVKGIQNRVIMIQNPSTKQFWGYEEYFLIKRKDTTYIHTTYLDNIDNLNEDIVQSFNDMKENDPKQYEHVVLGGWKLKADGVIFENWERGEFDSSLPYLYGADYGFAADPSTLIKVAIDSKNKKLYVEEKLYQKHLSTDQLKKLYHEIVKTDLVVCDSAELRLINDLISDNINAQPTVKKAGSVVAGIQSIKGYKMIVCGDSSNLVTELNNYHWIFKDTVNGSSSIPIDKYNHLLDALRYAFQYLKGN